MTLLELFALMRKHLAMVIAIPVACAVVVAAVCFIVLPNVYTASTSMYVLTKSGTNTDSITNSDLSASQMLTNDVATLIKSSRVKVEAAEAAGLDSLAGYKVSVDNSTTTRLITISVESTDPEGSATVANQLAESADKIAQSVMDIQSINVIDKAVPPTSPSGPPRLLYTLIALLVGLFVAIAIIVISDMANTRVRSSEEASEMLDLPVIGRIPVIRS